jgi:hypothetical protein
MEEVSGEQTKSPVCMNVRSVNDKKDEKEEHNRCAQAS